MNRLYLKEIERLEVTNLMDNFTDILIAGSEGVERTPFGKGEDMMPAPIAEHGFSALIKIKSTDSEYTILLDTGVTSDGVLVNASRMSIDLNPIEAIILTHGHVDHTSGLINILKHLSKKDLPVIMHPQAFLKRWAVFPNGSRVRLPTIERNSIVAAGGKPVETTDPLLMVNSMMLVSGEIPRVTDFEKGLPISYAEIEGRLEKDPLIKDDMAVAFNVKSKGLVVISGCAHAGIINTLKYLGELTGTKLYTVMGGFHLTGKSFESIIDRTISELKQLDPKVIIPSHCTGWQAISKIYQEIPDRYIHNSVGTKYSF